MRSSRIIKAMTAAAVTIALAATAACSSSSTGGQSGSASGAATSGAASGQGSASSPAAATGTVADVTLATLAPSSLLWLHAIADKQGFYAQHGVTVTTVQIQSSAALVQAVATGSADAGVSLGDNVIAAVDKGAGITITGALLQKAALRLYGAPGVTTIAGLKGTKVSAGAVSGGTADLLTYQLMQAGLSKSDVQLLALTNSKDRVVALKNKQISGSLLIPPYDTLAEADGDTMLGWYDQPYIETPLIVNKAWAAKNKAAATGLTQAMAEAAKWIYDPANAGAAQTILKDYTGVSAQAAKNAYQFMVTDGKVLSPDLKVADAGLQDIVDVSAKVAGTTATKLDISKYYDPSYLAGS